MIERLVQTMKRDYATFMPKPDAATAAFNLAITFEHYNEKHPHSALNRNGRDPGRTVEPADSRPSTKAGWIWRS